MIVSFNYMNEPVKILNKSLDIFNRIEVKKPIEKTEPLLLLYKHMSRKDCFSCLRPPMLSGKACPYFDKDTYSKDCRCPQFKNLIAKAEIEEIRTFEPFELMNLETSELILWATRSGFDFPEDAFRYYSSIWGPDWLANKILAIQFKIC